MEPIDNAAIVFVHVYAAFGLVLSIFAGIYLVRRFVRSISTMIRSLKHGAY
ncbi:MAG: hypothetical protein JW827_00755 [Spirochaetes bacterium]|nr:hypothetical protein [Spirochaetota bacterium]